MLKKLCEFKQEKREMEDFLLEFENLCTLARISKKHALEILQHNMRWSLMKKVVIQYGPPIDYDNLWLLLITIGMAEQYLSMIKHTQLVSCTLTKSSLTFACLVPQGIPMDVDRKKYPGMFTQLQTATQYLCYMCHKPGHIVALCQEGKNSQA